MTIYLNDLSLTAGGTILDNWGKVTAFTELFDKLAGINSLQVIAPKNLWNIPLSGYNVCLKTPAIPHDKYLALLSLYGRFKLLTNGLPLFSEGNDMAVVSSSVGKAAEEKRPVFSFAFEQKYETEVLDGWFQAASDKAVCPVSVNNIYKDEERIYRLVADISSCRTRNPLAEPFWNIDLMKPVLDKVDLIGQNAKDRESLLIRYGRQIAEMNGWLYNERITKKNTTSKHLRYIFDSRVNFPNFPVAYISLDMEGPNLAFELCDKRGRHLGEYHWDGTHKPSKKNHDIKVR